MTSIQLATLAIWLTTPAYTVAGLAYIADKRYGIGTAFLLWAAANLAISLGEYNGQGH